MDAKFTKSLSNKGTERTGIDLLLADARFQVVPNPVKHRILELIGESKDFGIQTFDAVMTPEPSSPITLDNIEEHFPSLRLVEMKTTRKPLKDAGLSNFFFGATEREYTMARELGNRYLFAFIVLNDENVYEAPFAVLLTLDDVEARTRAKRVQWQVNFRSDIDASESAESVIVLGRADHIPRLSP